MKSFSPSAHARIRMSQRNISADDVRLIMRCGTLLPRQDCCDLFVLLEKDVAREVAERTALIELAWRKRRAGAILPEIADDEINAHRAEIARLEHLRNVKAVLADDVLVTCVRLRSKTCRRALRPKTCRRALRHARTLH
jgi:hypothetical protein